jgi:hypothetical protein
VDRRQATKGRVTLAGNVVSELTWWAISGEGGTLLTAFFKRRQDDHLRRKTVYPQRLPMGHESSAMVRILRNGQVD